MLEKSYARYEAALHLLARYGRKLRQENHAVFEGLRVTVLAERLQNRYARYRQTGDLAPILAQIAHYEADPWQLNVSEDGLMPAALGELLHELKQGVQGLTLTVSSEAPQAAPGRPAAGSFLVMDERYTRATVSH